MLKNLEKELPTDKDWGVWKSFFDYINASKMKNSAWAQKSLATVLRMEPFAFVFGFNRLWLDGDSMHEVHYKKIKELLSYIKNKIDDQNLLRVFESKISYFKDEELDEYSEYSWSLDNIRSFIKERHPLTSYMGYWQQAMEARVSRTELFQYFDQTMNAVYLMSFNLADLWLFHHYFPNDEGRRDMIKKEFFKLAKTDNKYLQWRLIELTENSTIKKWLSEVNISYSRPLFLQKRYFFKELLNSGQASEFAIYNLMLLGDRNLDYMWWLCL